MSSEEHPGSERRVGPRLALPAPRALCPMQPIGPPHPVDTLLQAGGLQGGAPKPRGGGGPAPQGGACSCRARGWLGRGRLACRGLPAGRQRGAGSGAGSSAPTVAARHTPAPVLRPASRLTRALPLPPPPWAPPAPTGRQTVAFSTQRKESALRSKRLKRDASLGSLGAFGLSREPSRASLGAFQGADAAVMPADGCIAGRELPAPACTFGTDLLATAHPLPPLTCCRRRRGGQRGRGGGEHPA